jgi:hypothetical protein
LSRQIFFDLAARGSSVKAADFNLNAFKRGGAQ